MRSWKEFARLLPDECPTEARDRFLAWLVEVAGLLAERTDGSLAFTHLSFQEYLTALHLANSAADHDQRFAAFRVHIGEIHWWETLRLLASQIDSTNPEFLNIILRSLLSEKNVSADTLSFLGTVLADGPIEDGIYEDWVKLFLPLLTRGWSSGVELCARAWLGSRQEEKKKAFARDLSQWATCQSWLGWMRCKIFGEGWAAISEKSGHATTRGIVNSLLHPGGISAEIVAAGRILAGSYPAWPPSNPEIGALHLWPGQRRLVGLRIQSAASVGSPYKALVAILGSIVEPPFRSAQMRDFARFFERELRTTLTKNGQWDYARGLARDWAHYLANDWSRDFARFFARFWAVDFSREWTRQRTRNFAAYWANNWARGFARNFGNDFSRDFAGDWAQKLKLNPDSTWLENFALIETVSCGRPSACFSFAYPSESELPLDHLLRDASRLSMDSNRQVQLDLTKNAPHLDALWPALARHIARRSTLGDKILLEALARGDEKRPEPLSWGLQFIVRGDVLLDDGSVVTLDELADEAGVPRLPYFEEVEPELEVDWDADEAPAR